MRIPVVDNSTVALMPIKYPRDEFFDDSCIAPPKRDSLAEVKNCRFPTVDLYYRLFNTRGLPPRYLGTRNDISPNHCSTCLAFRVGQVEASRGKAGTVREPDIKKLG